MFISKVEKSPGQALGAWIEAEPVAATQSSDPRSEMDDQALVFASRNAFPVVAQQKARRDSTGVATGAAIALVLGAATFMSLSSGRTVEKAPVVLKPSEARPMDSHPLPAALPPGASQPEGGMLAEPAPATALDMVVSAQQPMAANMPRLPSPVMVYDGSVARDGTAGTAEESAHGQTPEMLALDGNSGSGAGSAQAGAARSTRISDPANTVAQGTLIAAVLETAINSDIQGYARAVVSQDVRSFDGSQVLVPRSSRLIGEYKSGLTAGQKRVYLIWTRLLRPDGVSVALASPSVDYSGQAGVGGRVNTHFLSRFGEAILLSIVGGAGTLASGGATIVVSGGQSAASMAAQRDSQRGPTLQVRPGEPIRVFTARDLIFVPSKRDGK